MKILIGFIAWVIFIVFMVLFMMNANGRMTPKERQIYEDELKKQKEKNEKEQINR